MSDVITGNPGCIGGAGEVDDKARRDVTRSTRRWSKKKATQRQRRFRSRMTPEEKELRRKKNAQYMRARRAELREREASDRARSLMKKVSKEAVEKSALDAAVALGFVANDKASGTKVVASVDGPAVACAKDKLQSDVVKDDAIGRSIDVDDGGKNDGAR